MFDVLKKIKTNALITAALYAVTGLALLLRPALSTSLLCMALGAVLLVCGLVDILIFLLNRDGTLYANLHLVLGIILAAVGIWLMTEPTLVMFVIPRIVGVLILVHGAADLSSTLTLCRNGYPRWTAALVLGIVTLLFGAVLVACPFDAFTTVVRLIGLFLLYDGISDIWITSRVSKILKQAAKEAHSQVVDVEYRDSGD